MAAFDSVAELVLERHVRSERWTESLKELRDTLLPKLMSGEIRIRAAETVIENVT